MYEGDRVICHPFLVCFEGFFMSNTVDLETL